MRVSFALEGTLGLLSVVREQANCPQLALGRFWACGNLARDAAFHDAEVGPHGHVVRQLECVLQRKVEFAHEVKHTAATREFLGRVGNIQDVV